MQTIDDLPELDFNSAAYQRAPFQTLSDWSRKWQVARSARGVEVLDYDLCRKAILDRQLGTGHPKLMNVLGLPEGRPLEYKRNSISFHNRGPRRRDLRLPVTRLMGPEGTERFRADIEKVVDRIIDAIPKDQMVDLISTLCDPPPLRRLLLLGRRAVRGRGVCRPHLAFGAEGPHPRPRAPAGDPHRFRGADRLCRCPHCRATCQPGG